MNWLIILAVVLLLAVVGAVLFRRYHIRRWLRIYATNLGFKPRRFETDKELRERILSYIKVRPRQYTLNDCREIFAEGAGLRVSDIGVGNGGPGVITILVPWQTRASTIERGRNYLVSRLPFGVEVVIERNPWS